MITVTTKDILGAELFADVLVNPVNTKGVPGAGLARQFSEVWPIDSANYARYARHGNMHPGDVYFTREQGQWIAHFASKDHWRDQSHIEFIRRGLSNLVLEVVGMRLPATPPVVALPMVGCGLGGLKPGPVIEEMIEHLVPAFAVHWRVHVRNGLHGDLLQQRLSRVSSWSPDQPRPEAKTPTSSG